MERAERNHYEFPQFQNLGGFVVKTKDYHKKTYNIVIRLSLEIENTNRKNSIITSYQLGAKTLKRLKKNNKTLYNKE